jgi:signal transduction histidine kinase
MSYSRWVALDCAAAALIVAGYVVGFRELARMPGVPDPVVLLLVLASALPTAARRVRPRAALAVVVLATSVATALSTSPAPPLAVAFVLYIVPFRFPRNDALWSLGGSLVVLGAGLAAFGALRHGVIGPGGSRAALSSLAWSWLIVAAAWVAGDMTRQRRARLAERARRAAIASRAEIARELHDVIAHSLSLIAVQAGVANWVVESQPAEAARALRSIEDISRGALREMRTLLGVLRVDASEPALEPARGLVDLEALAGSVTAAGVDVTVDVRGTRAPLPPGLELAAYRVIQEAVTNVVKHSGASHCQVGVCYEPGVLVLSVTDDGTGGAARPGGHGIVGMRERVAAYGREFTAGPLPGGGFGVTARFPVTQVAIK